MYLGKKNYQSFKFLVFTPKFLLTFLDKVSQILVLYNLGKNICVIYLYYPGADPGSQVRGGAL